MPGPGDAPGLTVGHFDPDEVLAWIDSQEYLPREEKLRRLSAEAHEAADWVVEHNLEIVAHSLRIEPPSETPCALCVMPMDWSEQEPLEKRLGRELDPLHVDVVAVTNHTERRNGNRFGDPIVDAWLGIDWGDVRYPNTRSPDFLVREDTIAAEANDLIGRIPSDDDIAEIDWHHWWWGWIFERVVRRLNEEPPVEVTPDFVAYFQDYDFGPWPPTIIRHVARPSAVALLDEQGLLPPA